MKMKKYTSRLTIPEEQANQPSPVTPYVQIQQGIQTFELPIGKTRESKAGLSIVRYAIAITISKVGQYSIANRFPIAISIVRPSQYTIVYWYPCSILNIVVKGRHPKQVL